MIENEGNNISIGLTAGIVSAYVSNNSVQATDIPALINRVHAALAHVSSNRIGRLSDPATPAVSIKKSVTADYIVCLEDGMRFKALKRHLRSKFKMTPEQYREKWGLAPEYPMVAPNYAAARSELAKQFGLGQQRRRAK
jgi:MucR family transcriptional regulator, transcriptional regulator of exopolysaccharide biosynthesis